MPRSPAPTDRGVYVAPPKARPGLAGGFNSSQQTKNMAFPFVRRCYGWFIYFRLRYDLFWSRRDINLGSTGGLCAGAYGEDNLLCNSGVLAWTPVGKQMGTRIPVRVTPHSSAHPNNTGGGEGGLRARPNGVFRKTAPPKRDTGRSPARGHVLHLCIDGEGWKSPRV